ncbi:MAG: hypothetical protein ACREVV_03990 [Steroidobacteraceae bacterium]
MQTLLIVLIGVHVVAGTFWAGTTFVLAHNRGAGAQALFRPQMGSAALAVLAGLGLWGIAHRGPFGPMERTLAVGIVCAIAAAGIQGATRKKDPVRPQRIAAGLLFITVVCMAVARYVG